MIEGYISYPSFTSNKIKITKYKDEIDLYIKGDTDIYAIVKTNLKNTYLENICLEIEKNKETYIKTYIDKKIITNIEDEIKNPQNLENIIKLYNNNSTVSKSDYFIKNLIDYENSNKNFDEVKIKKYLDSNEDLKKEIFEKYIKETIREYAYIILKNIESRISSLEDNIQPFLNEK